MPDKIVRGLNGQWQLVDEAGQPKQFGFTGERPTPLNGEGNVFSTASPGDILSPEMTRGLPMLAGLANLHPGLRSAKALAGVPASVETVRQLLARVLSGEEMDPVGIGMEGVTGVGAGMVGGAAKLPGRMGKSMVGKVVAKDLGPEAAERVTSTAIREGARLVPGGQVGGPGGPYLPKGSLVALRAKAVDLENAAYDAAQQGNRALSAKLTQQRKQIEELEERLSAMPVHTGSAAHLSLRPSGFTAGSFGPSPVKSLQAGQALSQPAVATLAPMGIEAALRAMLAQKDIEGAVQRRRRTAQHP